MKLEVSVCIPTYNYGKYLSAAIESVLSQSFQDFELLIVDDVSSDDTPEVMKRYLAVDRRIRFIRNEQNIGSPRNYNKCLQLATKELVKVLCADDLLEPTCLEESIRALQAHPSAALVACSRSIVDKDARPLRTLAFSDKAEQLKGQSVIRKCFFEGNLIGEPTAVVFRKNLLSRGFDKEYKQIYDLEMWMHILEKGDFIFIPKNLCKIRQHEQQLTKEGARNFVSIEDEIRLYNAYFGKNYLSDSFLNRQRWKMKLADIIWDHRYQGIPANIVNAKLAQYYPLNAYLFFRALRKMVRA